MDNKTREHNYIINTLTGTFNVPIDIPDKFIVEKGYSGEHYAKLSNTSNSTMAINTFIKKNKKMIKKTNSKSNPIKYENIKSNESKITFQIEASLFYDIKYDDIKKIEYNNTNTNTNLQLRVYCSQYTIRDNGVENTIYTYKTQYQFEINGSDMNNFVKKVIYNLYNFFNEKKQDEEIFENKGFPIKGQLNFNLNNDNNPNHVQKRPLPPLPSNKVHYGTSQPFSSNNPLLTGRHVKIPSEKTEKKYGYETVPPVKLKEWKLPIWLKEISVQKSKQTKSNQPNSQPINIQTKSNQTNSQPISIYQKIKNEVNKQDNSESLKYRFINIKSAKSNKLVPPNQIENWVDEGAYKIKVTKDGIKRKEYADNSQSKFSYSYEPYIKYNQIIKCHIINLTTDTKTKYNVKVISKNKNKSKKGNSQSTLEGNHRKLDNILIISRDGDSYQYDIITFSFNKSKEEFKHANGRFRLFLFSFFKNLHRYKKEHSTNVPRVRNPLYSSANGTRVRNPLYESPTSNGTRTNPLYNIPNNNNANGHPIELSHQSAQIMSSHHLKIPNALYEHIKTNPVYDTLINDMTYNVDKNNFTEQAPLTASHYNLGPVEQNPSIIPLSDIVKMTLLLKTDKLTVHIDYRTKDEYKRQTIKAPNAKDVDNLTKLVTYITVNKANPGNIYNTLNIAQVGIKENKSTKYNKLQLHTKPPPVYSQVDKTKKRAQKTTQAHFTSFKDSNSNTPNPNNN